MGSSASIPVAAPATKTLKRKATEPVEDSNTTPEKEESKDEEKESKPINYRPEYDAASEQQKEVWMCVTNTAKYCYSPWDIKRQCMLLDGFNMTEDEMYSWMAFSYSVKFNFAQPTHGFSPQELDTEPGLWSWSETKKKKQKQL
jgi:hypothetical protein